MRSKILIGAIVAATLLFGVFSFAEAQSGTLWQLVGNKLAPVVNSWGIKIPSLGSAGNPCVKVDASGNFGTTTCGGGAAITAIGPAGQTQGGPTVTMATSSDTNIGLTITGAGNTLTFTSNWIGTLANSRLTNSTISGVALGGNLSGLNNDATLVGTSYNGGAPVSNWGIDLANPNTWTAKQDLYGTASSTLFSAHQAFFGATATSSFNSAGVLTLATPLAITSGGTGASSLNNLITLGTHTTGNYVATLADSGGLTIAGSGSETAAVTAGINFSNANLWTGLQRFNNATSSLFSAYSAFFGGTATSTFNNAGDLFLGGKISGGGLTDCDGALQTLGWDTTTGIFTCGIDDTGSAGIATTTDIEVPQVAYFTKTGGLTTLGSVATGTISGAGPITVTANRYVLGGSATVGITADSIGNTELAFDTGQALTTVSSPTFAGLTLTTPLTVPNGGTGWASIASGFIPYGNGGSALATSSSLTFDGTKLIATYASTTALTASGSLFVGSANKINQHAAGFLDIQRTGAAFTLTRIRAPRGDSKEATLSLVNDMSTTDAGVDEEFVDFYNENYGDSRQWGMRQAYSGTGAAKPFIIGHWQTSGLKDPGNKLIILPSGTIGIAQATSTLSATTMLHIASSSAATLLRIDTTPGTNKVIVTGGGLVGIGTSSPMSTLSIGTGSLAFPDGTTQSSSGIMVVQDEKAANTAGGTSVAGTQVRVLNTVVVNTIPGASLAANQVTLPAGTYQIDACAPSWISNKNKLIWFNVTDAATTTQGRGNYGDAAGADPGQADACLVGYFTIASAKAFELRHWIQLARATNGLGLNMNQGTEVFSQVKIIKR